MNQRLREVINFLVGTKRVYNQKDFCDKLGRNASVVSGILTGNRPMSASLVKDMCTMFPEVNPDYLLDKDCKEMLRLPEDGEMPDINNLPERKSEPMDYVAIIKAQQEQIDRLLTIIEKLTTK